MAGSAARARAGAADRAAGALRALRLAGEALGVPGVRAGSLLDASPLRATIERLIDFPSLRANVKSGRVAAVCVVATALADGMPVGFLEQRGRSVPRASEDVRYARSVLEARHVLASSAIPLLLPPVRVPAPSQAAGYYLDGATRLNAPLRPAIELGAGRVLVVGFEPPRLASNRRPATNGAPHMADVAASVVDGLLVDQVNQDMRRLAAINTFFVDGSFGGDAARAYRESRGRRPYQKVSYAFVTPRKGRQLGALADRAFARRGSWRRPRQGLEDLLLGRLLRSADGGGGELLSLLMFDPEHSEALIEAGRADAGHWLDRHPGVWCADSAHNFDIDPKLAVKVQQEVSLAEWRALKRR